LPFPKLPKVITEEGSGRENEMERILRRMSCNKAIAFDGLSDKMFQVEGAGNILASL